jgi:fumarate reductase subunit C
MISGIFLLLWFGLALVVGWWNMSKGHSYVMGFLISALASPVVGAIVVALSKPVGGKKAKNKKR